MAASGGTSLSRLDRALLIVCGLAAAISQLNLVSIVGCLRPNLISAQLTYTPAAYEAVLASWGEAGLQAYRAHFAWDTLHPLLYGAFGYLLASRTPSLIGVHGLRWLLPIAAAFDYGENFAQLHLLAHGAPYSGVIVALSGLCSTAKWLLVAAFLGGAAIKWIGAGDAT